MKTIFKTLSIAAVLCAAVSCEDYLSENPTTRIVSESAFDSEASVEGLIYGVYSTIEALYTSNTSRVYQFLYASPLVHWKTTRSGRSFEQGLRGTLYYDLNNGSSIMLANYKAIYSCNNIIAGLQKEDCTLSEEYKKEAVGEACLLRAMMYFDLVRMFGDVPLNLEAASEYSETNGPRVIYSKIYDRILTDLSYAEENMRTKQAQESRCGLYSGRAHRVAATALKAQVYLTIASLLHSPEDQAFGTLATGYEKPTPELFDMTEEQAWQAALDNADKVIASGAYTLEPNYSHLFRWDPENYLEDYRSSERIIAFQVTPNGSSSMLSRYTLPAFLEGTTVHSTHVSSESMVRPCNYVFQKWAQTYGGTFNTANEGRYTSCNDPRIDVALIYDHYYAFGTNTDGILPNHKLVNVYPYATGSATTYIRKYFCPSFVNDAGCADFYYMRYAEIFLIAAEACAELDKSGALGDAYAYVEKIHERARNESTTGQPAWTAGQYGTGETLVNAIMWERVFELFGEYHEWFDTHRRGAQWLLDNIYVPIDAFLKAPTQETYSQQYWYDIGFELPMTLHNTRCGLLCEYPEIEIRNNTSLTESRDRNVYNQSMTSFSASLPEGASNANFEDDEEFVW